MNYTDTEARTFPERLKHITSQSHHNLENLPVSRSIVDPAVTKEEYIHYLSLMHDVVKDAEDNIFPALEGIVENLKDRSKTDMIENDLAALGYVKHLNTMPLSEDVSDISPPFALGILYVIEGSTLGGRFILKNITEALGYTAESGAEYFAGYGNATGSRWKSFVNLMEKYATDANEMEIVKGANYAFNSIHKHFKDNTLQ